MNSEDAFDLQQDRSVKFWSASAGSLFSGTLRGVLTAHLRNGEAHPRAECTTPIAACELARDLNLSIICGTPDKIRNVRARMEIMELIELSEMLPGRDNKNNWKKKLEWLKEQFMSEQDECDSCKKQGSCLKSPEGSCPYREGK